MPSIDQVQYEEAAEDAKGDPVNGDDVEILTRLGIQLLKDGDGLNVIKTALQESQDPPQVVGQFLAQLIGQLGEQVGSQIDIDMRAFLTKGGVLEHLLDYIEGELGLPSEWSDQVWNEVIEVIKGAARDPEPVSEGGQPPQPPQQPPQQGAGIQGAMQ